MKNTCLALLLLSCLSTTGCAQEQVPKLLREAAHCLAAEKQDWLDLQNSKATVLSLGYVVDTKTYPGEEVLYVVDYTGHSRTEGLAFTIFLRRQDRRRIFDIQNNAKFVRSNKENADFREEGVSFVEPPLWGIWTQQHIAIAIRRIERQPRFVVRVVRVEGLLKPSDLTKCESYADRK
jgi:hypothetical protein